MFLSLVNLVTQYVIQFTEYFLVWDGYTGKSYTTAPISLLVALLWALFPAILILFACVSRFRTFIRSIITFVSVTLAFTLLLFSGIVAMHVSNSFQRCDNLPGVIHYTLDTKDETLPTTVTICQNRLIGETGWSTPATQP